MSGKCEDAIIGTAQICTNPILTLQFSRLGTFIEIINLVIISSITIKGLHFSRLRIISKIQRLVEILMKTFVIDFC